MFCNPILESQEIPSTSFILVCHTQAPLSRREVYAIVEWTWKPPVLFRFNADKMAAAIKDLYGQFLRYRVNFSWHSEIYGMPFGRVINFCRQCFFGTKCTDLRCNSSNFHKMHTTYLSVSGNVNSVLQKLHIQIHKGRWHLVCNGIKRNRVLRAILSVHPWQKPPF